MQRRLNKIFLIMLAVMMSIVCFVFSAQALEVLDSGKCGDNVTWTVYEDLSMKISGTGPMWNYDFAYGGARAWDSHGKVKKVIVESGVTKIGNYAFELNESLSYVSLADTVLEIGNGAFMRSEITNIDMSDNLKKIGNLAFESTPLSGINFPEGLEYIGKSAFSSSEITQIKIPSSVKQTEEFCFSMTPLTKVEIAEGLEKIARSTFSQCFYLSSINLPTSLKTIEELAFYRCASLTSLTIPANVSTIGNNPFSRCTRLELKLNSKNTSFKFKNGALYTSDLKEIIYYPYSKTSTEFVVDSKTEIINGFCFEANTTLQTVILPENLKVIEYGAFNKCTSLVNAEIPDSVTEIQTQAFAECKKAKLNIPSGIEEIGYSTFYDCDSFAQTIIYFPDTLKTIGNGAFLNCDSITQISIGGSVESLGENIFSYCDKLETVTFRNGTTEIEISANDTLGFFEGCLSLKNINLPASVEKIGDCVFKNIPNLEKVVLPEKLEYIGYYAFSTCPSLKEVDFSACTSLKKIEKCAFENCSSLTLADLSGFPELEIEDRAFYNCTKLNTVKSGAYRYSVSETAFENTAVANGSKTFYFGKALVKAANNATGEFTVKSGTTDILAKAFSNCSSLNKINIPATVTYVGANAFLNCSSLKEIYYEGSILQWNNLIRNNNLQGVTITTGSITADGFEITSNSVLYPTAAALAENYDPYFPPSEYKPGLGDDGGADWARHRDKIKSVSFPKNAYRIGEYALAGLNNVSSLTIPSTVTSIGAGAVKYTAFYDNADNWVNNVLYSGNYAFAVSSAANGKTLAFKAGTKVIADNKNDYIAGGESAAKSPVSITIPASVINVGKDFAFAYSQLESINVNKNNTVYSSRDGILYDKSGKTMIKYPENKSDFVNIPDGTVTLGEKSLHGYNFSVLWLPDSVKTISNNIFGSYFSSTSISLILFEGSETQWKKIAGVSQFGNIEVFFNQKGDFSQVKDLIYATRGGACCITEDNKAYFFDSGEFAITNIEDILDSYTVEELHFMEGITEFSSFVYYADTEGTLKKLCFPSTITYLDAWTFTDLSALEYVSVENANFEISDYAFSGCKKGIELHLGKNVNDINWKLVSLLGTVGKISVDKNNKTYCAVNGVLYSKDKKTLHYYPKMKTNTSFVVPDGVETIAFEAFCSDKLTKVTIPTSVKTIDKDAFYFAKSLKTIAYKGSACNWKKVEISADDSTACSKKMVYAIAATDAAAGHTWKAATCTKAKTCKTCGATSGSKLGHKYTNSCDKTCDRCSATRTITHTYKTTAVTKATLTANGKSKTSCAVCGYVKSTGSISYPKTFTLSAASYTYDGKAKTPTVTVKDAAGKVLTKGTDYTVSYASGRTAPGTYKVTVTMKGNYTGIKTLSFKINPINISTCKVQLSATSYTFDGKLKTPTVTVTNSYGTKLTKDKHYTVTYSEGRKNAGTYKVTVKMMGNYTGTKTLTFKINPINISTCKVQLSATSYTFDGKLKTPTVTVTNSYGTKLTKDKHYTVTYSAGRKNAGTYNVKVTMIGNYTGTKTLSFKINPINISTCKVQLSATSFTYNGYVKTPTVTVTNSYGTKLTKDTHYTVTYSSGRKNAGTYNVKVTMKGNYTGTKTLSFKINPVSISKCTVKLSATSLTYNGKVRSPYFIITNANGTKLTKDTHYTVTYSSGRKAPGTYKVTVKMKGNYTGTKTLSFKINPINISTCTVKLSDTSYTYNGKVKAPTVTVTNSYGTRLTQGTHYTVTYQSGRTAVGTYKVTVTMKGNYTGTKTLTFRINPPQTTVVALVSGTKSITVNLKKQAIQTTGYQIQYSTSSDFTNAKTKTITSNSTVKTTLTGLASTNIYYVRVRTYKTVNNVNYYSAWSVSKYVKTK